MWITLCYFSAAGHAYERQPSRGLDVLPGIKQDEVSFAPDRWYEDGKAAVVDNRSGKGRTRTIGTTAGYGYKLGKTREPGRADMRGGGLAFCRRAAPAVLPFQGYLENRRITIHADLQ